MKNKISVLLPGSYDPMTLGHLDVIRRAAEIYDKVFVGLLINPEKKYMFSDEDRIKIAELSCSEIENVKVVFSEGYTADLAKKLGCTAIVKGIRNEKDLEYERGMARFNEERVPGLKTEFMPASQEFRDVSSTSVRQLLLDGRLDEAKKYLHRSVANALISGEIKYANS